jgi:hypothetical protein
VEAARDSGGARLAIGIVYATLIAAEIIAGSTGIGWMVFDAGRFLRSDDVFVGIGLIGLTGLALDRSRHREAHRALGGQVDMVFNRVLIWLMTSRPRLCRCCCCGKLSPTRESSLRT